MGGMFAGQPDGVLAADDPDIFPQGGGGGSSFLGFGEVVKRGADFFLRGKTGKADFSEGR